VPTSTKRNAAAIAVVRAKADRQAAQVLPVIAPIRAEGITTHAGIARVLNARGIRAPRGGEWTSASVRNLLARALPRRGSIGTWAATNLRGARRTAKRRSASVTIISHA